MCFFDAFRYVSGLATGRCFGKKVVLGLAVIPFANEQNMPTISLEASANGFLWVTENNMTRRTKRDEQNTVKLSQWDGLRTGSH